MRNASWVLAFAMLASGSVFAQETSTSNTSEGQTKIKVEEAKESKNKVAGDIDEEITNAKLRAESGSKSKWSISTDISYRGGSVNSAFGAKRPNLSGEPGQQTLSSISLDPSVRYRWSKNNSLTVGTSVGVMTPFQGSVTRNRRTGKRVEQFNVFDPSVSLNRAGKIGALQTNSYVAVSAGTSTESRSIDNSTSYGAGFTVLHGFQSGLTLGTSFAAGYNLYTSKPGGNANDLSDSYGGDDRTQWSLGIYPFVEYGINDRFSFRTLFGYFNFKHVYGDPNHWRLLQTYVYQSVGVGISVTRDIFLYPNIQFVPSNARWDFTNVAMSASINVF